MDTELRDRLISMASAEAKQWNFHVEAGLRHSEIQDQFEALRIENAEELEKIIHIYGWPGKSLVGEEGATAAFRIARFAIDRPHLMMQFLGLVKEAVKAGEAKPFHAACLEDCILFYQQKAQFYGMFFDWDEFGELTVNVKSVEQANRMREDLGLKTLEEDMALHKAEMAQQKNGLPEDPVELKKQSTAWAKRVGWV